MAHTKINTRTLKYFADVLDSESDHVCYIPPTSKAEALEDEVEKFTRQIGHLTEEKNVLFKTIDSLKTEKRSLDDKVTKLGTTLKEREVASAASREKFVSQLTTTAVDMDEAQLMKVWYDAASKYASQREGNSTVHEQEPASLRIQIRRLEQDIGDSRKHYANVIAALKSNLNDLRGAALDMAKGAEADARRLRGIINHPAFGSSSHHIH
ncbi:hypothetical protein BJ170DRAFT_610441 [Xylariales sp. AK1849]|nr:hypothetical protein BJ170DRAFT_610441 [Xylariales sp. AK1849]